MLFSKSHKKLILAAVAVSVVAAVIAIAVVLTRDDGTSQNGTATESSSFQLPSTTTGQMLVVERLDANGQSRVVARSYDGYEWEILSNQDSEPIQIRCTQANVCAIDSPGRYQVRSVEVPTDVTQTSLIKKVSRLHLQATFGASKAELDRVASVYGSDFGAWIVDQTQLPPTFIRTYYRQRTNPRPLNLSEVGPLTTPCDIDSRWSRFVLDQRDLGKNLVVSTTSVANRFALSIDGFLRGEVSTLSFVNVNTTYPATLQICTALEQVGGSVTLSRNLIRACANSNRGEVTWSNPAIEISNISMVPAQVLRADQVVLVPVSGSRGGAFILKSRFAPCTNASTDGAGNAFLRVGNSTYRFDQRVRLFENTVEKPISAGTQLSGKCPLVSETYQNRDFCARRSACGPQLSFKEAKVPLNETILRAWYSDNGRFVYYMANLRLDPPFDVSPCTSGSSRWLRLRTGTCPSPTSLDATTLATLQNALSSTIDSNPYVRDVSLSGINCNPTAATIGAQVEASGECFKHVHPDMYSVRDATRWSEIHDGNQEATSGGGPNPIAKWALQGLVALQFPVSHPMTRWSDRRGNLPLVGRYGDEVDFASLNIELQSEQMARRVGAFRAVPDDVQGIEACGSMGEVANRPELGHHFGAFENFDSAPIARMLEWPLFENTHFITAINNVALSASDQLRQRVAWSLANVLTMSCVDIGYEVYPEGWANYYDIFVRHAFGSYLDILRDVSYHPIMGIYLSFAQNKAFAVQAAFPDENYAREIMQLFSIGLWKLNDDGTQKLDDQGQAMATYTNADIVDFARLWTGLDRQSRRNNQVDLRIGTTNLVDPMVIKAQWRDRFPKAKLDEGYLGDGYPLCDELPPQPFLREGTRYEFTGDVSVEGDIMDAEAPNAAGIRKRFSPTPGLSALHRALCAPRDSDGKCTFPLRLVLSQNLPCYGPQECGAARIFSVKIVDPIANLTKYYSVANVPCVRLALFNEGRLLQRSRNSNRRQCADPEKAIGSPVCCSRTNPTLYVNTTQCLFANERTDWATNQKRCNDLNFTTCTNQLVTSSTWLATCAQDGYMWTSTRCSIQLQIFPSGQVGFVDSGSVFGILQRTSNSFFRVRWANDSFPIKSDNVNGSCPNSCQLVVTPGSDSCLCSFNVTSSTVFARVEELQTIGQDAVSFISSRASIGASKPSIFDAGTYSRCTRAECLRLKNVTVWLHQTDTNGLLSQKTIFELPPLRQGRRVRYLLNRVSTVLVGTSFSFRNPPHFAPLLGEQFDVTRDYFSDNLWSRQAEYEIEALLEHLFEHDNTAPFLAYRLIQHLVTSNPSPRYVKSVTRAFKTGAYGDVTFSGKYGDLEAMVYAILMDREARSSVLEADPSFGMIRDPLVKFYHLMRSLEYTSPIGRQVSLSEMQDRIGVQAFKAPSVFGFYLPEYQPAGPISQAGLVGPQAQILTTPNLIGFMNGVNSLIDNGLTSCVNGFGSSSNVPSGGRSCSRPNDTNDGILTYKPPSGATCSDIVEEISLLLTAGRLNRLTREVLVRECQTILNRTASAAGAVRQVLKLVAASPEFQTLSVNKLSAEKRQSTAEVPSQRRRFKAVIVVFQSGGVDSYNMLVPHSQCASKDLYAEYQQVRQDAALDKATLLPISVPASTQPCATFGVHPSLPRLRSLYSQGEALFAANVGSMVEPVTRVEMQKNKTKRVPPSLYAHNVMQRNVQNCYAQKMSSDGVLGRVLEALEESSPPYQTSMFSLAGNVKMIQGSVPPDYISASSGIVQLNKANEIRPALDNLTQYKSESLFSETYSDQLHYSVRRVEQLGTLINSAQLNTTFGTGSLSQQLRQVSRLIKSLSTNSTVERATFFTQLGGFDTHMTFDLSPMFSEIDAALGSFSDEMRAQGLWDDVVVVSASEFARTLTPNGAGTDHAWAGHYFVAGGKVKGSQILGPYPDALTEEAPLNLGRGRLLPTIPFEALWKGIAEWFGVDPAKIPLVLPNAANFPSSQLFSKQDLFRD